MCSWNPIRDILESGASLVGNYLVPGSSLLTDNLVSKGAQSQLSSPLGELAQVGSGLAGGGALGSGLQSAGGAAEAAGLNSIGSTIGDAASTGWNNFTQGSGLSSLLGGTPETTGDLTSAYNGITNAAGTSPSLASSAATTPVSGAVPINAGAGAASGGTAGGGFNLGTDAIGEADALPSSSSIGAVGNPDFGSNFTFSDSPSSTIAGNTASPAASAIGNAAAAPGSSGFDVAGIGANQGNTGISGLIAQATGNGNMPIGSYNYDLNGSTVGDSAQAANYPFTDSGSNMGTLTNLSTNGASNTANGGTQLSNGGNMLNSLLKGGLGYLLNQPNTAGANAINSATQQAQAGFAPYTAAGQQAESTLANLYGNNGAAAQTAAQQDFTNTPGYQFALNQGINAVNANAAAMGNPLSGNNEQAINNYAQGTASQTYNNYVNQLQNLASGGLTAAGGSGTAGLAGASAVSQLDQNKANNANTSIGTALNGLFPTNLNLSSLLGLGNAGAQSGGGNANSGLLQYLLGN